MFPKQQVGTIGRLSLLLIFFGFCFFSPSEIVAQTNQIGNGGIHTVQGRIITPGGRRSDILGMKITLVNMASNDLSVIADSNGTFTFKNLMPGPYTVHIKGGDLFEDVTERVEIDAPGSSNLSTTVRMLGGAKFVNIPIYLKPKISRETASALEVINAKLASVPKPAVELYENAQRSINEKNETLAITQLRSALSIHREFSLAWNLLGQLLQKADDTKGAIEAFRSAIKYDGSSATAHFNLGNALFTERSYAEAEKHLAISLSINPVYYRGHYYMGLTQVKLGRNDVAEQAFKKAIEIGGSQAGMAHQMLAGIYWSAKRYKEAATELDVYLKLEPQAKDAEKIRASIAELRSKQN